MPLPYIGASGTPNLTGVSLVQSASFMKSIIAFILSQFLQKVVYCQHTLLHQGCLSFIRFHIKIWKPVTHHWTFWTVLFKPPGFHIKTTKTCWPTHNRQFFERTEILFLGSFPRNCCNSSFWNSQEVGELPDLWNKVLCHLVRLILPLNGFLF